MEDLIIKVEQLTKKFKNFTAVDNLHLNVHRGDIFGFLGPNGAGKSTTIRMLLTLVKPNAGDIQIFGKNILSSRNDILRKIGAIVEKPDFYMYLSAYKNLEILGKLSGADTSRRRIMELLGTVGLDKRAKSKVKTFSHGMKQRLGLAQALLHDPELIILDEPTTGLDPQGMKEVRELIRELKDKGKTIFLSSHILREVELIANRMIIINKGKTLVEGTVDDLLKSDTLDVTFEFSDIEKASAVINESRFAGMIGSAEKNEYTFKLLKEEIPEANRFFVSKDIDVIAISPRKSLEEYFLKITEQQ